LTDLDPFTDARAALLDHLPKAAILARFQVAGGQELISGEFAKPEPSAGLVAEAFGYFADRPQALSLPGLVALGEGARVLESAASGATDMVACYRLANGAGLAHEFQAAAQNWSIVAARLPEQYRAHAGQYTEGIRRSSNIRIVPDIGMLEVYKVRVSIPKAAERPLIALLEY